MSLALGEHPPVVPPAGTVVVKEVRALVPAGSRGGSSGNVGGAVKAAGHWINDSPIASPMSVYPLYKGDRRSWGKAAIGSMIVEVELTNGMCGVGVGLGGEPGCYIVEEHLSRFVEGQDPRNIELIWDQMWRSTVNYGRKGLPVQALSVVDIALWDALGKLRGEPVYQLLGGRTKDRLPVYATTVRPDLAKAMGFVQAKIPLPYGPGDGDEGMRRNIERIQEVRATVGPDYPISLDCYMSLTVPYTIQLARRIDREVAGGVKWIEEHLPPDDYAGHTEVREKVGGMCLFATGEHEYSRYGFRQLIEGKCCDVLQPDITWCGGITETRRICALAAAHDLPVIPHGSSVFSFHLQFAFPNCPIGECPILSPKADSVQPYFGNLFTDEPLPKDGYVDLDPGKPGFGVTLNPDVALRRPYIREAARLRTREALQDAAGKRPSGEEWLARASKIQRGEY